MSHSPSPNNHPKKLSLLPSPLPAMSNTIDFRTNSPNIALFPSAGMGHLNPFLRLAAMLSSQNCIVTLITAQPTVSVAESDHISSFISTHPEIKHLEFQILPFNPSNQTTNDPFYLQFQAISRSVHLLHPLLSSSSPPLSAIFSDFALASSFTDIAARLSIPNYIVFTSSARFFPLMAYLPVLTSNPTIFSDNSCEIEIPGLTPLPKSSIPPPFSNPNHLFTAQIVSCARNLPKAKGILMNTFEWFESDTLSSLNSGSVLSSLPPVLPIGPVKPYELEKNQSQFLPWLDKQPAESVVYVSFGSRTAMSKDQIREMGNGLERSGCRFLWVLKTSKVDKDGKEERDELLGSSFLERTKSRGLVVNGWVNQEEVLSHPAIGGFISHCGWNSVIEAAQHGIPMLAWPQHGDQRVNADVVMKAGLGIWERSWGWGLGWGDGRLVKGEEIGEKLEELMGDEKLRGRAKKVREEATKASGVGGSSEKVLIGVIEMLR